MVIGESNRLNNFAVSSDGLATALQDSASALMEGGNNLEQSVALIAAANKVVQDPNSVGSALRTISLRLRGTSVEVLSEMGEETDGVIESTSKLQEKIKALSGVNILTESGAYKDTYTILKEIGSVWEDMSDIDQSALLELMAGKNRANTLAAILGNMEDLQDAYDAAMNSEGSALKENAAYLDSIQGRIDKFNNSLQTMWMNWIDSDVVKGIVDIGTFFVDLAGKVDLVTIALSGLLTYLNLSSKSSLDFVSMLGIHNLKTNEWTFGKEGLTGWVAKLFKNNKKESIKVPISIEPTLEAPTFKVPDSEQLSMFSDEYAIDIALNQKMSELKKAKSELQKLKNTKFKDIQIPADAVEYQAGNRRKAYLNEVLIPNKEAEIAAIEADINDITNATKSSIEQNLVELEGGQFSMDLDKMIKIENAPDINLNDIFANFGANAQSQLNGKFIDFSDFETAAQQIDEFNAALGQGQQAFLNYLPELNNVDVALQAYLASLDGGNASLQGFQQFIQQHNTSLKQSSIAAKAAAVGHQLLNAALSMGISLAISFALSGLMKLINSEKEAADAARDAAKASKELTEQNSSLEKYKTQIRELRDSLDSNNLSESEAYDARKKLLEIQDELISKFGLEKDGINLVTGAIEDQIAAIDDLSKQNAQKWLNDNQKSINKTIDYFNNPNGGSNLDSLGTSTTITNWGPTRNVFDMVNEYARSREHITTFGNDWMGQDVTFSGSIEEVKTEVEDFQAWLADKENEMQAQLTKLTSLPQDQQTDDVKKQITSLEKDLEQIKDLREDMGVEATKWFGENSTYAKNKELMDEIKQKTALAKYSDQYMAILQAQNDFKEAQVKGDQEGMKKALDDLNSATEIAMSVASETYMDDFFSDLGNQFKVQEFELNLSLNEDELKAKLEEILAQGGENGLSVLDDNAIKDMVNRGLNVEGATDESGRYTNEQIQGLINLQKEADSAGISIDSLISLLVKYNLIAGQPTEPSVDTESTKAAGQTYSILMSSVSQYTSATEILNEAIYDNVKISEDQYETLKELIGSEEEFAGCIDTTNGYVVKNSKEIKRLVAEKKRELVSDTKLAKSQAQLQYYELYKEMAQLTNGQKITDQSTLNYVNSLYAEMTALQKTIAKFSMLEAQLLGTSNAYEKLAEAQQIDSDNDYGSKAEELVNVLAESFNTAELGTEAAQVAIAGLIPESVFEDADTLDEKMQKIYEYFTGGEVSKLFTIEFDDNGGISSVEMTKENVEAYVNELLNKTFVKDGKDMGTIFSGTWDEFTLNPEIETLEDFANAIGVTEEVAFAFLTSLEKYDISWLGGDGSTLLDQLMGDNLEYQIYNTTQKMAELQYQLANGKISAEEYRESMFSLSKQQKELAEQAATETFDYYDKSEQLKDASERLMELQTQLETGLDSNGDPIDVGQVNQDIASVLEEIDTLSGELSKLEEPTAMTITLASEYVQEQINDIEGSIKELAGDNKDILVNIETKFKEVEENGFDLTKFGLSKDSSGNWTGIAEFITSIGLDPNDDTVMQTVTDYLNLVDQQHTLELLMGSDTPNVVDTLENISTVLQAIADKLGADYTLNVKTNVDTDEVTSFLDTPLSKTINVGIKKVGDWLSGFFANGTAHVNGTTHKSGTAHKSGSWGAPKTETALVGELGPELRVRGNKWTLIGANGAEFTDVRKGDIIFNHKQTEDLLKNGYVTGRGKAYANGISYGSNSLLDRMRRITESNKLDQLAKYAEEMCEQYEKLINGNVDLRRRPHLSPSYEHELAMSGGYNSFIGSDGVIYASTSAETWTIGEGESQYTIDITPVLENGETLTSDSLAEYVNNLVTDGSMQDLLNSDKYNLIIRAVPGEYNEEDWAGFEDELSKYKDGYLDTILDMFNIGGEKALEAYGFSPVGLADVSRDLQDNGSYTGKEVASAIDNTSEGMRNLDELINQYVTDVLNAKSLADEIGTDLSKTQYGNVNTDTRQKLYWDEESIDKYSDAIDSWEMNADDLIGSYSTLLGMYGNFDGVDIAFSPILQTEDGPQLLDSNAVNEYIWGLIDKASKDNGQWTSEELFQLDTKGLEFNGTTIKNLLADIGESANTTSQLLHYVGDTGAIANLEGEIETTASELVAAGENASDVQAKLNLLNATNISDKTFTVTEVYQTVGSGRSEGVHIPGSGGRYTKYANGTVHVNGNAYNNGNFGAPKTETALVGELGPEMVVRNGHWFTVGDNGAEFTDIQRGDIIFNHKQTEDLLSKGYVSGRGKAFAEGNAYAGIDTWDDAYNGLYKDYSNTGSEIKDAAGKLSKAAEDISDSSDEFKEVFDWIEVRIEEITEDIDLKSAKLENAVGSTKQNAIIDDMIALNKKLYDNLTAGAAKYDEYAAKLLEKVPAEYRKAAQDGSIAIESFTGEVGEETLNAIQDYRDWVQKGADLTQQAEETLTEIANLAKQAIDNIASDYENKSSIPNIKIEQLEAYNALIETTKGAESAKVYQAMIKENNKNIKILEQQRDKMQAELNAQVEAGNIKKYSQAWYDAINDIAAVDTEIIELTTDTANYQDTINELHWEHFDNLISRFEAISDEANNLIDILGSKDLVDKDSAEWTDEGITALGLYAQQMEVAEMQAKKYEEEIKYLNKNWKSLGYTEQEYVEKLEELKSGQYDAIKAYNDAKDAIVDLNQERIDAIKSGIEKEISAYEELIEKKKELLDSEKD